MKKWIILDLDGTLNNDEKKITPKTQAALLAAQEQGASIILASGRPTSGFKREIEALQLDQHDNYILSYNGGKIINVKTGEVIYENAIPLPLAKQLCRHLEQFNVTPIIDDGTTIYTPTPDGFMIPYESKGNYLAIQKVDNIADAIDFSPVKVLIAAPNETLVPLLDAISAPFQEQLNFTLSAPFYYEATMSGIDKASSLKKLSTLLAMNPKDMIAFGDAQNDLSMVQLAGYGVAMGNACEALKEEADEVTLSNNEDGIAHTLAKFFDL